MPAVKSESHPQKSERGGVCTFFCAMKRARDSMQTEFDGQLRRFQRRPGEGLSGLSVLVEMMRFVLPTK